MMTGSAQSATSYAATAKVSGRAADLRLGGRALAGSYLYEGDRLVTGWHAHDLHQIEYAIEGIVEIETARGHYLLPPQQAIWLPAGLRHQATMSARRRTVSVMFDPRLVEDTEGRARVLAASPVIREMMIYAVRWPIERPAGEPVSDGYFRTLGHLVREAFDQETPLSLPSSTNPLVSAAMTYTREHLEWVTAADVARAVAVSERSLRREFRSATGMSWRDYVRQARLLQATALLASTDLSVRAVSTAVGFDSVSSFGRAFALYRGEMPSAYRRRLRETRTAP
jgi:AraC-like DNA-binding protein